MARHITANFIDAEPQHEKGFTWDDLCLIRHVPFAPYEEAGKAGEYGELQRLGDRIAATGLTPVDGWTRCRCGKAYGADDESCPRCSEPTTDSEGGGGSSPYINPVDTAMTDPEPAQRGHLAGETTVTTPDEAQAHLDGLKTAATLLERIHELRTQGAFTWIEINELLGDAAAEIRKAWNICDGINEVVLKLREENERLQKERDYWYSEKCEKPINAARAEGEPQKRITICRKCAIIKGQHSTLVCGPFPSSHEWVEVDE